MATPWLPEASTKLLSMERDAMCLVSEEPFEALKLPEEVAGEGTLHMLHVQA